MPAPPSERAAPQVVRPWQLMAARRGGFTARYAAVGPVLYAVTEVVPGTHDEIFEAWCELPHWAILRSGALGLEVDGEPPHRFAIGEAFYVPGLPRHRFLVEAGFMAVGFAPLPEEPIDEAAAAAAGFRPLDEPAADPSPIEHIRIADPAVAQAPGAGLIEVESALMGPWICAAVRFGAASGYLTSWCDQPHWGVITSGSMAIETEDDIVPADAGDAYVIPAGPPGHRLQVVDAATIVDYTPLEAYGAGGRVADWRPRIQLAPSDVLAGRTRAAVESSEPTSPRR